MSKSKEQLQADLALAEKNLNNPAIKDNPTLKASLEKKIASIKAELGEEGATSAPAKTEKKEVKKISAKKEAPKKEAKPKKEKAEKKEKKEKVSSVSGLKVKVGDKVTFEDRESGKKITGELVKLEQTGSGDAYNAYVETKDGKRKVRAHKLEKA